MAPTTTAPVLSATLPCNAPVCATSGRETTRLSNSVAQVTTALRVADLSILPPVVEDHGTATETQRTDERSGREYPTALAIEPQPGRGLAIAKAPGGRKAKAAARPPARPATA